jgi:hypothetical protein
MDRHYKNRCGEGKVASNGFLTNLVTGKGYRPAGNQAAADKVLVIQSLFPAK